MPDTTALDHATAMIERAWGQPVEVLHRQAVRKPGDDPLLTSVMRSHDALSRTDRDVLTFQDRLHALTRPGRVLEFYNLNRITEAAADLRVAHSECNSALQSIRYGVDAREAALKAGAGPSAGRVQAATARSTQAPRPLGMPATQPASPAPASTPVLGSGPRR